ncbi:MAG: hypothetical protein WBP18_06480, partial [Paracoccaceae bacterium]
MQASIPKGSDLPERLAYDPLNPAFGKVMPQDRHAPGDLPCQNSALDPCQMHLRKLRIEETCE